MADGPYAAGLERQVEEELTRISAYRAQQEAAANAPTSPGVATLPAGVAPQAGPTPLYSARSPLFRLYPWLLVALVLLGIVGAVVARVTNTPPLGIPALPAWQHQVNTWLIEHSDALALLILLILVAVIARLFIESRRGQSQQRSVTPAPPLPRGDIAAISLQITRLEELRNWMTTDAEFARLVDAMIGQQVQAAEQRQRRAAVRTTVISAAVSLIAGWLLSAVSPVSMVSSLFPH
jgi:hypothetical protein